MSNNPMMKCGCAAYATHRGSHNGLPENHPCCIIHGCCETAPEPDLTNRKARCAYYGKPVKTGAYNGNCCDVCAKVAICQCERPSSPNLWFFKHQPDQPYDEFYCACQGAD
jgi:hypothetical protein